MQSHIFSVAKRSQNLENSTYLWYGCSRGCRYFLRPDLQEEGFYAIMGRKYEV